ncbi:Uncharacterized conserved protein YbbK, DUF523 family [Anaerobranca californiensis DSM 14826]|uniref:Uncharacterized conserved protein YbbK, DUF523 family n=2 Tax=Anaerobranca TaxID=42447 RepID=A0A1M6LQ60_9FIRM|nr:Uncharacterized conserved protein YbbK, DUF523 family [Anaerobranca californiensis DSM 14826]
MQGQNKGNLLLYFALFNFTVYNFIMKKIVISSCLLGACTKYDGGHNKKEQILKKLVNMEIISLCPEVLGGLPTPRPPAEIIGGDGFSVLKGNCKVLNNLGEDVTENFIKGAKETLRICLDKGCQIAILKGNSPSCSNKFIYDGSFRGKKVLGLGVTAALLIENNIKVFSEEDDLSGLF